MAENSENVILEPSSDDKVVDEKVVETTDEKILEEALDGGGAEADTNETGKMSSKSSDISIEEINAEGETVEKSTSTKNAAEIPIEEIGDDEIPIEEIGREEIPIEEIGELIPIEEIGAEEEIVEKTENAEILIPEVVSETSSKDIVKIEPARIESISDDDEDEDEDDDFEDETIFERVTGLSEMFPKGLTSTINSTAFGAVSSVKWLYGASRSLTWVMSSSFAVMFFPMIIEIERLGIEEAQKQQQRQILLGPGAAMSGGAGKAQQNAPLPTVG